MWDLTQSVLEPVDVIENITPWWEFHPETVAWANSKAVVALSIFDGQHSPSLYTYVPQIRPNLVENPFKLEGISYIPTYLTWDPNDQQLAYWGLFDEGSKIVLVITDIANNKQPLTFDSEKPARPLFWSPDGAYLTFVKSKNILHETKYINIHTIYLVDIEAGECKPFVEFDTYIQLIGWLEIPASASNKTH